MFGFEFANPKYFLLLILLVPMIVWYPEGKKVAC